MKRLTNKDVYAIVNSVEPVPFRTNRTDIFFEFISDSRFDKDLDAKLNKLVSKFKLKAEKFGLQYRISPVRTLKFPPESSYDDKPTFQKRVTIYVTKPIRVYKMLKEKNKYTKEAKI